MSIENMYVFPSIIVPNSKGKSTQWTISVGVILASNMENVSKSNINDIETFKKYLLDYKKYLTEKNNPEIVAFHKVDSFQVEVKGGKGKIKSSKPTFVLKGKNIGKSNETTVVKQAINDAQSLYNKKRQKSVNLSESGAELYPPMLAQIYKGWPEKSNVFIQRKLNGLRCVATRIGDKVILYSRHRKLFHLEILQKELMSLDEGIYLDGELYKHGAPLEEISGIARNIENSKTSILDYVVYDLFIPNKNLLFSERYELLKKMKFGKYIHVAETFRVYSDKEVKSYYKKFLEEKYEGAIVRLDGLYKFSYNDYHCPELLKIKETLDNEFKLVDFTNGTKGKGLNLLMLVCETAKGKIFTVTPALPESERADLFERFTKTKDFEKIRNLYLIVEFDEYTVDGIPSRARTSFRFRNGDEVFTPKF